MAEEGDCKKSSKRKLVVWDEANLEFNEANKTATMKIDEPKTPWASPLHGSALGEEEEEMPSCSLGSLDDAMEDTKSCSSSQSRDRRVSVSFSDNSAGSDGWQTSDEDPEDTGEEAAPGGSNGKAAIIKEKKLKRKQFAEKRKVHYDEFAMVLRARQLMAEDDDG
mmetsp:Transcript_33670/g.46620  ORF Transcript_33670/g.46620 Transcript_33670/m.46620 type:complete len:165 (-) Transcript_33670:219-713(-)|eukprot:CAMPEP_0196570884 /NCGR_PEP_ID=MMETSP1081-20130531/1051_1 /TAXON_ID=36882 /ORGANISM="Pyramimonas amylifera, Strain CCMP720" /LENGTH=164 /DNA_ID=CAMNT_0041887567 /DNA_START=121 /DNA_END=615 /DNA_ORIENTATION=+